MNPAEPRRPFGLLSAAALVVANMVGAGVFTTSGFALADLGSRRLVLIAWVVGGVLALCGAISYGGLVRRITESGGEYLFLSRTVHPAAGFLAGWVSLLGGFTGAIALAATAFESYLFPGGPPAPLPAGAAAIAVILLTGLLHGALVRVGVAAQNLVVALKLLFLLGFVGLAFYLGAGDGWPGTALADEGRGFVLTAFAGSLVWISLSYSGFNAAVYVAGEVRDPARNVPRALWLGTLLVGAFYLALNTVFLFAPPPAEVAGRQDVAALAAQTLGGRQLELAVRGIVILALLSSVSSMIVAGPRVYARMADDGVFPRFFGAGAEGAPPRSAIALQTGLALLVAAVSQLSELLSYLGFLLSLGAAASVACLFLIRRRDGREAVAGIGYPLVPALYVGATVSLGLLAAVHRPAEFGAAVVTVLSGLLAYLQLRRRN